MDDYQLFAELSNVHITSFADYVRSFPGIISLVHRFELAFQAAAFFHHPDHIKRANASEERINVSSLAIGVELETEWTTLVERRYENVRSRIAFLQGIGAAGTSNRTMKLDKTTPFLTCVSQLHRSLTV